ncbi:MAG: YjjG family noncanonical pyrimidine nucleotidase [Bacteroidales bacterium]|nr:YjjG family noncanonical pyrimidine nucleotidase [Bacteroidales bacterium]MCL2132809.1 YjjG family noncanonical pyrimidine nucleotidase [Bacteroidales bacterium]
MLFFQKKYRTVFFDLDHTLWDFDTNAYECIQELFEEFGLQRFTHFEQFFITYEKHNKRLWAEYEVGSLRKDVLRSLRFYLTMKDFGLNDHDLAERFGWAYTTRCPLKTNLFPHAKEVLEYLRPKYRMAIISNGFPEVQDIKLKSCGIVGYFDKVFTSEMVGYQKPRPEIFHAATTAFNAKKKHCLMVGDSWEHDILGAQNYGIDQVFFNPKQQEQRGCKATYDISSLKELTGIL